MKLLEEVSHEKRSGSYYTPTFLVQACFDRIALLAKGQPKLKLLEPAAGDGAFIRSIPDDFPWTRRAIEIRSIEMAEDEAAKCAEALRTAGLNGTVECNDFFSWARRSSESFSAVVGNPPFVRYQFVPKAVRAGADLVLDLMGQSIDGVSNLWIPFVLVSLGRLKENGSFALVLPSELFTIKSAGLVRHTLIRNFSDLTLDLYPRDSFPEILQDVIVVSGRRSPPKGAQASNSRRSLVRNRCSKSGKSPWRAQKSETNPFRHNPRFRCSRVQT